MISVRKANEKDIGIIYEMIRELAVYEKLEELMSGTEEELRRSVFEEKTVHACLAEIDGAPAGYCLYFYNFSSFKCRKGLFIEDIYVRPKYRGEGLGRMMLILMADIAGREGCGRLEWNCLQWNPTEEFYMEMGAERLSGWDIFRVDENDFGTFGGRGCCCQ
jgi:GNAT superfamily N-acetyltransferase